MIWHENGDTLYKTDNGVTVRIIGHHNEKEANKIITRSKEMQAGNRKSMEDWLERNNK